MNKYLFSISVIILLCFCLNVSASYAIGKKQQSVFYRFQPRLFDDDWLFKEDSLINASATNFNDTNWRKLSLPHDFAIERQYMDDDMHIGPFVKSIPDSLDTGYIPGGTGWYRKHFKLDKWTMKQRVSISFDGVSECSDVWINGYHLGFHPNAYTPFQYDITPFLKPAGDDNILVVKAFSAGKNSRWYLGAGIYRHVHLIVSGKIYVPKREVQVITHIVDSLKAKINVVFPIQNETSIDKNISFRITLLQNNRIVWTKNQTAKINAGSHRLFNTIGNVVKPVLWSLEHPFLYKLRIDVFNDNNICDSYETHFGIRSLYFSAERGFLLNGKPVELKGACVHHDNGLLGSAAYDAAEIRRVKLLKDNGFNAIRTSHNPPSTIFLDACDQLGMLVIDEAFDMWERPKLSNDYHLFFKEYAAKDITSYIKRDRNHPCVIMWSIGNEINERVDSSGIRITSELVSIVKSLDITRPVTEAICYFWDHEGRDWSETATAFSLLDVSGYNYTVDKYESDHKLFPSRIIVGTETFPREAYNNWHADIQYPFVLGSFVWTGMDYIGEVGVGNTQYINDKITTKLPDSRYWPWFVSYCGDIDIIGGKKPQSFYRDVLWGRSHLELFVHSPIPSGKKEYTSLWGWPDEYAHWNWKGNEGKPLVVHAYTDCDSVRLYLNNVFLTTQKQIEKLTATFIVPYASGELRAEGIKDGKIIANCVLRTTGAPDHFTFSTEKGKITNNPNDLLYVNVNVVDSIGNIVPTATTKLHLSVEGNGRLLASGNAAPDDMKSFRNPNCLCSQGKCLVILQPRRLSGNIVLKVSSDGMPNAKLVIPVIKSSSTYLVK
jgi:beta-galactosidase